MKDKKPQITYLFGAGASANALPTIKEIPIRIKAVKDFIAEKYIYDINELTVLTSTFSFKPYEAKEYILEGLEKLSIVAGDHSTIDTYAKKLYINGKFTELKELSFFLALYFNIEQKMVGIDPRYDTFLISILDSGAYRLPDNLKFLSWNYDLQMEGAHEKIIGKGSQNISFSTFNTDLNLANKDEFVSLKINGQSCFQNGLLKLSSLTSGIMNNDCQADDLDFALSYAFLNVKNNYSYHKGNIKINFAWSYDKYIMSKAVELYNSTEILVVIGYSFPFFNRFVDRNLIRSMTKLKKIYIQDLHPDNIRSRFLSILPNYKEDGIEIITITDLSEFFLPPEL